MMPPPPPPPMLIVDHASRRDSERRRIKTVNEKDVWKDFGLFRKNLQFKDVTQEQFDERFEKKGFLGEGSFGQVYRYVDRGSWSQKVLAGKHLEDVLAEDIQKEYSTLWKLRKSDRLCHPNVNCPIDVMHVHRRDGTSYYIVLLEYGTPLHNVLLKEKETSPKRVQWLTEWFKSAVRALDYIHSKSILHTDIKPDNLLITKEGLFQFADLGGSCVLSLDDHRCSGGMTLDYAAPEQHAELQKILLKKSTEQIPKTSIASEVFSLGATFYACFYNKLWYPSDPSRYPGIHAMMSHSIVSKIPWHEMDQVYQDNFASKPDYIPVNVFLALQAMLHTFSADRANLSQVELILEGKTAGAVRRRRMKDSATYIRDILQGSSNSPSDWSSHTK